MKSKINDTVQLVDALTSVSLPQGAIGVVVAEFSEPEEAYEVEFSDAAGRTVVQLALRPSQIVVMS
jgi:hypothetical protein